jgi:hypothetical protein
MSNSTSLHSAATGPVSAQPDESNKSTNYDFGSLYPRRRTFKPASTADAVMEYLRLQGIYTATDFERAVRDLGAGDEIWRRLDPDDDDTRMWRIAQALSDNSWLKYVRHWYRHVADDKIWTLDDFDRPAHSRRPVLTGAAPERLLKSGQ